MQNPSLARKMGIVGIIGAVLWVIAVLMQRGLNLYELDGSVLSIAHELLFLTALTGVAVGFLGLIPGGAVASTFGKTVVILYVVGRGLIIFGGLACLLLQGQDSPISLVFPIGGTLGDLAALLIGIVVIRAKRFSNVMLKVHATDRAKLMLMALEAGMGQRKTGSTEDNKRDVG